MKLSIIIPTLNEAVNIVATLEPLQALRQQGHEIIIADGGSSDNTITLADGLSDQIINASRSRARQMNNGADTASGDVLLFLHADTVLANDVVQLIEKGFNNGQRWGRFDVKLSGAHPLLRIIEFFMNLRSRLSGIATGDQAIFIERELFNKIGGFPDIPLMEDIAISKLLKPYSKPLCLKQSVTTSSRRWEENGILHTILLMWRLRLAYFFGADPQRLVKSYQKS